jgi:hypothetical protein
MFTVLFIAGAWASAIGIACATSNEGSNSSSHDEFENPVREWEERQPYNP